MDRTAFWKIIDDTRSGAKDEDAFLDRITTRLRNLSFEELVEFQRHFDELLGQSYRWDLWGAAYVMNGGCSDDGFEYFRAWLIAQGQQVFHRAIANPDSLAELENPEGALEELMYVAPELYREKTGREMPDSVHEGVHRPDLGDDDWDFDDAEEMKRRYPTLFAKYGYGG